jgi:hypothetical protein
MRSVILSTLIRASNNYAPDELIKQKLVTVVHQIDLYNIKILFLAGWSVVTEKKQQSGHVLMKMGN